MYRLTTNGVTRLEDGAGIPADPANLDYAEFLAWQEAGGTPLPVPSEDWRTPVWDDFRERRDLYLSRLSDIAGRYARKGVTSIAPAADAIAEGLLALPSDTAFSACPDRATLQASIVARANQLMRDQLTANPTNAADIKAALDKVFK